MRHNVWTLPPGDDTLAEYAAAVSTMMARSPSDPTSWSYQAAMHGTHASQIQPLYNGCQHGTWYFLPWHRMFLYYFERIVRAAVVAGGGAPDWTLPFWDYEAGGQQATLPAAFRPGSAMASLQTTRRPTVNGGSPLSAAVTSSAKARACPTFVGTTEFGGGITGVAQFSGLYGQLETQPHNAIHDAVGGTQGVMSDPRAAAQDPIFWLHHSNIDRLWWQWTGAQHPDPADPRWSAQTFEFFDEHGQRVSQAPADVLDTEGQLGYTYEVAPPPVSAPPRQFAVSSPGGFAQSPQPEPVGISAAGLTLSGFPESADVDLDAQTVHSFLQSRHETLPSRVYLELTDIEGDRNPGTVYGIYVNLPDGASAAVAEDHHAGTLSFFGIERSTQPVGDEPGHGLSLTSDITELLTRLSAQGEWDGQRMRVTLRPLDVTPPDPQVVHALPESLTADDAPVRIGGIRVLYR